MDQFDEIVVEINRLNDVGYDLYVIILRMQMRLTVVFTKRIEKKKTPCKI